VVANARTALARAGYPQVHVSGPAASRLVADLLGLLAVWDAQHRAGPGPRITVHRGGSRLPEVEGLRLLVPRRHSLTAITWPGRCR
jgi:protein-L-isoaspartate(D-aspartate) O-methyltransferase